MEATFENKKKHIQVYSYFTNIFGSRKRGKVGRIRYDYSWDQYIFHVNGLAFSLGEQFMNSIHNKIKELRKIRDRRNKK